MACLTSSELENILLIFARGQFPRYKSAKQKVFNNFRIRSAMSSFRRLVLAQAPLWPDCPIIVQQLCVLFSSKLMKYRDVTTGATGRT